MYRLVSDSTTGKSPVLADEGSGGVRLDVWLWAVRVFKTRSQAAEACRLGRVTRCDGELVKPSRLVRPGDELVLKEDFLMRRVRVDHTVARRVSAKLAQGFLTDFTPPAEVERARELRRDQRLATPTFSPGTGRPTKAQRRALESWHRAMQGEVKDEEPG